MATRQSRAAEAAGLHRSLSADLRSLDELVENRQLVSWLEGSACPWRLPAAKETSDFRSTRATIVVALAKVEAGAYVRLSSTGKQEAVLRTARSALQKFEESFSYGKVRMYRF